MTTSTPSRSSSGTERIKIKSRPSDRPAAPRLRTLTGRAPPALLASARAVLRAAASASAPLPCDQRAPQRALHQYRRRTLRVWQHRLHSMGAVAALVCFDPRRRAPLTRPHLGTLASPTQRLHSAGLQGKPRWLTASDDGIARSAARARPQPSVPVHSAARQPPRSMLPTGAAPALRLSK